ncbi:MAG: hypothetical protein RR133_01240 [Kiritimatiellia bacterium]
MITVLINLLIALTVGIVLTMKGISPWYWSILWGILTLVAGLMSLGWILRRRMASLTDNVQLVMKRGQAKMQAKIQRWRSQQMSNVKAAEAELSKDRDAMIAEVQGILHPLEKYRLWIPLLGKQLATMELQFAWQRKDYKRVDLLLPRALLVEPMLVCIKLARGWQLEVSTEELRKIFKKSVRRARYGSSYLIYCVFAWMLVKRNQIDEAYKILIEADKKNENAVIKSNRDLLANNRINHFSNAGLGDEWYALYLEEPKLRAQRQRPGRYFA